MAVYLNDAIWRRLSDYYNVTAEQAQVGDLYKRWLDEKGLNWYSAGDYFISQFPGVLNRGDAEWLFWTGGFGDDLALLLDAAQEPQTGSPQYVLNCGDMRVSDARLGSVPRQELRGVTRGLIVPGVASAGNYTRVPDEDALDITGDLDVRVRFSAESIATGTDQYLLGRYDTAGNQRSWTVSLTATGRIAVRTSGNGTLVNVVTTTPAWPYGARQNAWLRFTVQPNFGGRMVTNVYHAPDSASMPSQWTLLESFDSGVSGLFGGTAPLEFGTIGLGTIATFNGNLFYAQVRSGIDGTVVLDADFAKATPLTSSFTAGTGQTVTISGATGVDSNDPTFIQHTGTNYLYLPGVASNYASVPDEAALDITGDIEIVMRVNMDTWTPGSEQYLLGKYTPTGDQRSYAVSVTTTGRLAFRNSVDGIAAIYRQSDVVSLSGTVWLKITLDVDTGANTNNTVFSWAADSVTEPTSWTQITATTTTSPVTTTTSIFPGSSTLAIGGIGTGTSSMAGKVYRAIIRNGIGGTKVFDADFTTGITNGNQTSFTAGTGQTVTINRSATGKKSVAVTRPCWLFGTNSYMTVADNDLLDVTATQSFTVLAVGRKWGNGYTSTAGFYAAKQGDPTTQPGYRLGYDATTDVFAGRGGGATVATGARGTAGEFEIIAGVRNVSADTFTVFRNGVAATAVSDSTTATLANSLALNVGRIDLAASSLYADMELFAVAVVRRALNATELEAIQEWFTVVPVVPPNPWAPPKPSVAVTNATTTTSGDWTIQSWTTSGSIQVAGASLDVEYLVVAGGGGGGWHTTSTVTSGGGGAGGLLTNVGGSPLTLGVATHTITVGAGGARSVASSTIAPKGTNSSIGSLVVASGGGGGMGGDGSLSPSAQKDGGSGGGGGSGSLGYAGGSGVSGQGNGGGTGFGSGTTSLRGGGGGGGAGAVGTAGSSGAHGAGGSGSSSAITGSAVTYAGGGGGGGNNGPSAPSAASGGGGTGVNGHGTDGLGGGGGGWSGASYGGDGGDGIVIVRYLTSAVA